MLERNAINKHKRQSVVIGATVLGPVDLTDIPDIVDIPDLVDIPDIPEAEFKKLSRCLNLSRGSNMVGFTLNCIQFFTN